jgi:hypothetical protein
VPYQVIGAARGSTMDSFIMGNGTGNGAVFAPTQVAAADGFASNQGEELMLQATLGTGPDARYVCPGGTKEAPPAAPTAPVKLLPQTDGVNRARGVAVAVYCRVSPTCDGTATLSAGGGSATLSAGGGGHYGSTGLDIPAHRTSHVEIHLTRRAYRALKHRGSLAAVLSVTLAGQTVQQPITLKIF